jgi:hypothetical protein
LRPGQSVSDDAVEEAQRLLNEMVDAWQIEKLMIWAIVGTSYVIPAAGSTWTMGPLGTLAPLAPVRLEGAGWTRSGYPEQSLPVLTLDEWREGRCGVWNDGGYPLATISVRPAAAGGETLTLYAWTPLTSFASPDLQYDFPPGYSLALRWNLALQLAPLASIQKKIPDVLLSAVQQHAIDSKAAIKSLHSYPPPVLRLDGLGCGCYNICTDS